MINEEKYIKHLLKDYQSPYSDKVWNGVMNGIKELERKKKRIFLSYLASLMVFISTVSYSYFLVFSALYDIEKDRTNPIAFRHTQNELPESVLNSGIDQSRTIYTQENARNNNQYSKNNESISKSISNDDNNPGEVSLLTESNIVIAKESKYATGKTQANMSLDMSRIKDILAMLPAVDPKTPESLESVPLTYNNRLIKPSLHRKAVIHDDPCLSDPKFKLNLSGDIYWSHEYGLRTMSARNSEFIGLADMRNSTESSLYSYSSGFRLSAMTETGFGFRTGLNYSQINERFRYLDPESSQVRTITTVDYIYQNGIIVDSIVKREEIIVPGTLEIIHRNTYRLIDIPILFAIEKNIGKSNFYYSINAGVFINLQFSQKVRMLETDLKSASYYGSDYNETATFERSLNSSLFLSTGLHYRLLENIHITIEPNLRLHSQSFTLSDNPISQSYINLGLITGMRYLF